jgi:hypothetical protein
MPVSVIHEEVHVDPEAERPHLRLIPGFEDQPVMEPVPRPAAGTLEGLIAMRPQTDPLPAPRRPALPFQFPTKEVVAVLSAIALIISVRLSLVLGFMATASLFWIAATAPSIGAISAAGLFAVLVFWPLSWLALKKG